LAVWCWTRPHARRRSCAGHRCEHAASTRRVPRVAPPPITTLWSLPPCLQLENEERRRQEAQLARELEEANALIEDQYASMAEEVEAKTRKLRKVWNKLQVRGWAAAAP